MTLSSFSHKDISAHAPHAHQASISVRVHGEGILSGEVEPIPIKHTCLNLRKHANGGGERRQQCNNAAFILDAAYTLLYSLCLFSRHQ